MVPIGMSFLGFSKSPLMAIPAVKPVTAGKKMPNNTANETSVLGLLIIATGASKSKSPKKTAPNDKAIAERIKYCDLIAIEVLI